MHLSLITGKSEGLVKYLDSYGRCIGLFNAIHIFLDTYMSTEKQVLSLGTDPVHANDMIVYSNLLGSIDQEIYTKYINTGFMGSTPCYTHVLASLYSKQ